MPPICSVRGALEELEQARDDVDGHARVAADADRVQQVLVLGARERDHHAVDAAEGDQIGERVQRAEARDAEAAGLVDVVVDVADRVQPELGVAVQPLDELERDVAGAEDERALAQRGRAVQRDARGGAAEAGAGAARRPRRSARPTTGVPRVERGRAGRRSARRSAAT